jgi:hypothetical protein
MRRVTSGWNFERTRELIERSGFELELETDAGGASQNSA